MWYIAKCFLKVQVDEVHCFVVTRVVGVNDIGKEVKQSCLAAALVSEAMFKVRVLPLCGVIILHLINLSIVLQTIDVRLIGLKFPVSCLFPF